MILSEMLRKIDCPANLLRDGSFSVLEQCTRIRAPQALTYLENGKYLGTLEHPDISCVICTPELADQIPSHIGGVAVTASPKLFFFQLHNMLVAQREKVPTKIDPSAEISPQAYIAPYDVVIGPGVQIQPFAVILEGTTLSGKNLIGAGSVIGCQNFDVIQDGSTQFMAKNGGRVYLAEGVDISSGSHVECGTLEFDVTYLDAYVKLDNHVLIGHGSRIGRFTMIAGRSVISGNCSIGENVFLGVGAVISNRITIGDGARVSLGSVVTKDVPAGQTVTGNFAVDHRKFLSNLRKSLEE